MPRHYFQQGWGKPAGAQLLQTARGESPRRRPQGVERHLKGLDAVEDCSPSQQGCAVPGSQGWVPVALPWALLVVLSVGLPACARCLFLLIAKVYLLFIESKENEVLRQYLFSKVEFNLKNHKGLLGGSVG